MASVTGPTRSSFVRARRGAPDGRGGRSPGLEQLISRRSLIRPVAPVDANGISQVPWRSVPCLCPAPGPRSSRRDLAFGGLVDAAPGFPKPKASAGRKISRLTQGFSIRCLRFTSDVAATHARTRFRLAGCASTGRASNPLDRCERFQVTSLLLSRTCPVARVVYAKTKVGYEIPINRHFYVYRPPRPLGEIEADIAALEGGGRAGLLKGLVA